MKIVFILLFSLGSIYGASFDCSKASTKVEKEICSNERVSSLDEKLARVYKTTKKIFIKEDKTSLVQEQRRWIKERNRCMNSSCLIEQYSQRVEELKLYEKNYNSKKQLKKYERKSSNKEAFLNIKKLGDSKYLVWGDAFYNIHSPYGPNFGSVNFIAEMKDDTIIWKMDDYKLTIVLQSNGLNVYENRAGPFGLNVSFEGLYKSKF